MPAATGEIDVDAAAAAYAADPLATATTIGRGRRSTWCSSGVRWSHAALFLDRGEIQITDLAVTPRDAPKPPAEQLTLTRPVINSARCVWLVVSGGDKAAALGLALACARFESVQAAGA